MNLGEFHGSNFCIIYDYWCDNAFLLRINVVNLRNKQLLRWKGTRKVLNWKQRKWSWLTYSVFQNMILVYYLKYVLHIFIKHMIYAVLSYYTGLYKFKFAFNIILSHNTKNLTKFSGDLWYQWFSVNRGSHVSSFIVD